MPRTSEARPVLLDTHVWLWLAAGTEPLRGSARDAIAVAAGRGNLRVAAISVWEIAMLASRNRIVLGKPSAEWVREALSAPGLSLEPLDPVMVIESCHLPAGFRSDPADHMIVATARIIGATLMTRDRRILDYAEAGHVVAAAA
jgi:PIN domain nuclease of toxin-antitoxin system